MENKKKPAIRFKGFCDDWEQRKVAEIGNIITGSTPKTSISDNYGGEFLFVSPADIQGNRYVDETITTLTKKGFDQGRKIRERASLFVSIGSTIGKVAQTSQESTTNQQINAVEPYDNFDDDFIFTSLENISGSIKAIATNQAVPIVNKTTFGETEIQVPSELAEQQRIGAYFRNLDHLITLHQRKCNKLQLIKKSMLEKMFPQNSQNIPEVRFKGFTDAWEQRKLGDMCQITMGQSPDGSTYSEEPSDYILVQGNADLKDGWVNPRIWTTQKTKTAQAGDLIMSVRAPAGAMGKTAYDVILGRGVAGIKGNEFLYQSLVKMDSNGYWKKMAAGSTFESVNSDVVKNADMVVPQDMEEQEKIGFYFQNLDRLITLHQRKSHSPSPKSLFFPTKHTQKGGKKR